MTSPVTTLTRAARIRTMSNTDLAVWIDRLLDMRLDGADVGWCDPEMAALRAEQVRRSTGTA